MSHARYAAFFVKNKINKRILYNIGLNAGAYPYFRPILHRKSFFLYRKNLSFGIGKK